MIWRGNFRRSLVGLALLATVLPVLGCRRVRSALRLAEVSAAPSSPAEATATGPLHRPADLTAKELIWSDGALQNGWQHYGWSDHQDIPGGPAQVDLSKWGGWIIARPGLTGQFGGVVFRYKAPESYGDFLQLRLSEGPRVRITSRYRTALPNGWFEVYVPIGELSPDDQPFDRLVLSTARDVPKGWVAFDRIGLTAPDPSAPKAPPTPPRPATARVLCTQSPRPISELIYGIAYHPRLDREHQHQWKLGATARRWGGNPASRYNWQLGNAWNTAEDWFFENVDYSGTPGFSYRSFLEDNAKHGVKTALTVPILGWVAKDTTSVAFPRSAHPEQQAFDEYRPSAGNGKSRDGKPLAPASPTVTSVKAEPAFIERWVSTLRAEDAQRGRRSVDQYILDNEPALWNSTHRDVHPEPLTYDELLERTIAYGSAIRRADPDAEIAGPAEWGWPNYFYSAKDMAVGHRAAPDRRAHGDLPLIAWYLERLRDYEAKTGVRVLDVLDLHFYPQGKNVYSSTSDPQTAALRLRQTRGLWDPSYKDESWIEDSVRLVPRMQEWVDQYYPGRKLSIGEWNFGAEGHISGGLATAEALGRFGQYGVHSAFYWTYPPEKSPAFWAFAAYRNFDGKGGHFESLSVPAKGDEALSVFASRSGDSKRWVVILLNLDPRQPATTTLEGDGCDWPQVTSAFVYTARQPDGFVSLAAERPDPRSARLTLPPYSIAVLELTGNGTSP